MKKITSSTKIILINAANLHGGGGLQVAVSFLYELSFMSDIDLSRFHIIVSSEVNESLIKLNANLDKFSSYEVYDTYGLKALNSALNTKVKRFNLVFTIFGPNYLRVKAKREIVGFAQPWILDFNNPISRKLSFMGRYKLRIKFNLQWLFFLRSHHYIVELDHVKRSLHEAKRIPKHKISIVHNTVSSLYKDKSKWNQIHFAKGSEDLALGLITRDYPHKNLKILPEVAKALKLKYDINVHFYTTLNDIEWETKSPYFKQYVSTVGALSPDQCPSFYEQVDGVIFPSLLECFSATPLEAMVMKKPLFASDRDFVRDVCHEHAIYIDPLNANDIALKIASYFKLDTVQINLSKAKSHALNFSSARQRAEQYLQIINDNL